VSNAGLGILSLVPKVALGAVGMRARGCLVKPRGGIVPIVQGTVWSIGSVCHGLFVLRMEKFRV